MSDRLTRPLVAFGSRLSRSADRQVQAGRATFAPSLLLGVATGLLWAPCAGPVLGLILTGAALHGANVQTTFLLAAYAAGAATSLALALLVGGRVFAAMKGSFGVGEWLRRGLGAAMLAGVAAIALGLDTGILTKVSLAGTASLEQGLLDRFHSGSGIASRVSATAGLPVEGRLPALSGAVEWLGSPPLTADALKGKVLLVDFWTYSCINCLRALPDVQAWADKYRDQGLVVIGVHAPEFAFEKNVDNVRKAIATLGIDYPVAIDNDFAIWRAFGNDYWPAHYFVDAEGRIRHHHYGEGYYAGSERIIQQLLAEAGRTNVSAETVAVAAPGVQAAPDFDDVRSPETYIGSRAEHFISRPAGAVGTPHVYAAAMPRLNEWGLTGNWTIGDQLAVLNEEGGSIVYRFHARDLHLVLGRRRGARRSGSGSRSTARRPVRATARTLTPRARAS